MCKMSKKHMYLCDVFSSHLKCLKNRNTVNCVNVNLLHITCEIKRRQEIKLYTHNQKQMCQYATSYDLHVKLSKNICTSDLLYFKCATSEKQTWVNHVSFTFLGKVVVNL